jgi:hypothetical protein
MDEGMLAILLIFGLPIIAILTSHRRKVLEIRHAAGHDGTIRAAVDGLRGELGELRDTTTRFDLSFDSALQRLESRIEHIEQRLQQVESRQGGSSVSEMQELRKTTL